MYNWRKGIAQWRIKDTLYLSVVFTWDLSDARKIAEASKLKVRAGGCAVSLMPDYLADVAEIGGDLPYSPLPFHNPLATFTTRGCPNRCGFCAVHRLEPEFIELDDFEIKPIICDNNLLASSRKHFDRVIDKLKILPFVDFNQGLEAELFTPHHADRISELHNPKVRFALDTSADHKHVADAITLARSKGLTDFGVYVLFGYQDTPTEARERLEWVRSLDIRPTAMRYQPLDAHVKNSYVDPGWTELELESTTRYYNRLRYFEHIPFEEYRYVKTVESGSLWKL